MGACKCLHLILAQPGHQSRPIENTVEFESKDEVELSFPVTILALYISSFKRCSITTLAILCDNMQPNRQLSQYRTRRKGIKLDMIKCRFCRDAKQKVPSLSSNRRNHWKGMHLQRAKY